MTMTYARGTRVSVERSRVEMQTLLRRHGASRVAEGWEHGRAVLRFELGGLVARIEIPMPTATEVASARKRKLSEAALRRAVAQAERERWRAFVLLLKAKLESCRYGAVRFEEEFLSHVVLDDGRTVGEAMEAALREGSARLAVPALPGRQDALMRRE